MVGPAFPLIGGQRGDHRLIAVTITLRQRNEQIMLCLGRQLIATQIGLEYARHHSV